jgi:hypothetical protein
MPVEYDHIKHLDICTCDHARNEHILYGQGCTRAGCGATYGGPYQPCEQFVLQTTYVVRRDDLPEPSEPRSGGTTT